MARRFREAANLILVDPRRNFDKGKTIERWRRKVTGLTGRKPQDGGTAEIQSQRDCLGPENH